MNKTRFAHGILAMLIMALLMITGCGSSSTGTIDNPDNSDSQNEKGEVVVSLTDAPGDFSNYTVDVRSLTLTKANGATVTTLPLETRLDFSQYTDMTEFLTASTVPSGVYTSATMTLDFSNADIRVENEDGNPVEVTTILDADGNSLTTIEVTVRLQNRSRLVVAPGVPAHLLLDFNLEATNQVSFDNNGTPTLTVDPILVADVNRNSSKLHRLRGLLNEVSVDDGSFSVYLRPFYHALTGNHSRFGLETVKTSDSTTFDINGEQFEGHAGLSAMAELTSLTAVVAVGDLKFEPLRFEAREVYAGSSVPGGELDVVEGSVVARQGNTLTVKGATLIRQGGTIIFNDQVTVSIGADTKVSRQFSADPFDKDDISIGQRVVFGGQLTDTDSLSLSLDATLGYARMQLSTVRGIVKAVDESNETAQLTLDVQSINLRRVADFDFAGTGTEAANDADADDYQIHTDTLDLGSLTVDAPVKVRGFVQPFGQAPADFNAQTIIGVDDVRAFMKVKWSPSSSTAFESISADGLVLNLDSAGSIHHVIRGWIVTDLIDFVQSPTVSAPEDGTGLFVIRYQGTVQVVIAFEDFMEALQGYLEDGAGVKKLAGIGEFDDSNAVLTAEVIEIQLD